MALSSKNLPIALPESVARLQLDGAQTGNFSKTSSPVSTAADFQEHVEFLTLPREIRDKVYLNIVVATDPIQYDENFETLSRSDAFTATALMCMFEGASNAQIARETREIFYKHNTFLVYTHDIAALLGTKIHSMYLKSAAADGTVEHKLYTAPFDAGAWVTKLAVRVGWHTVGGWFTDECCENPASALRILLESNGLRSVIIDARFGAWSYGHPQGIGWCLLAEMKKKWGKDFKVYNDQTLSQDTHRYTTDRRDISDRWTLENGSSQKVEDVEAKGEDNGQMGAGDDEEVRQWGEADDTDEGGEHGAAEEDAVWEWEEEEEGEGREERETGWQDEKAWNGEAALEEQIEPERQNNLSW